MDFSKEIVLITGASNGIGKALAEQYASKGSTIIMADVDEKNGKILENKLNSDGRQAFYIPCDVQKQEDIQNLFLKALKLTGIPTILINNAGVSRFQNLFHVTAEDWDHVLNTNLRSVFLCSKEAASYWKEQQIQGRIVNIASTRTFMSEPDSEAYAASKGGMIALTHALALSLSPYHIRVNSVSPGWIETQNYDELSNEDHEQHPAGRVGNPEDVAKACLYLTDPKNSFVTGENIVVDGGMTRKMIYVE
ncbi:MAG: SDR family oxidoreductase [Bacillaceae bacterium]|nr:SDR family oxidoreductase [Bacillaceae bacterium]